MHIKQVVALCLGVVLVVGVYVVNKTHSPKQSRIVNKSLKVSSLPQNATFLIDNQQYQLFEGESKEEYRAGAESSGKVTLDKAPTYGDIDGDGDDDALVILVHESNDSGLTYHAAIAWYERGKYTGTDTVLLGERVTITSYEIQDETGKITFQTNAEHPTSGPPTEYTIEVALDPEMGRIRTIDD